MIELPAPDRTWGQLVGRLFSDSAQNRGYALVGANAVILDIATPALLVAEVAGSQPNTVEVAADPPGVTLLCSCRSFQKSRVPCEHIWATLVAAERRGVFPNAASGVSPTAASDRPAGAPPAWLSKLETLGVLSAPLPETQDREIVYIVEVGPATQDLGVLVEVAQRQQKAKGGWTHPKPKRIDLEHENFGPQDTPILAALLGAEREQPYPWRRPDNSARFWLSGPLSCLLVPLLCATGRCRVRLAPGEAEPPVLEWREEPWEFCLDIRPEDHHFVIGGLFRQGSASRPLADAACVTAKGLIFFRDLGAALLEDGEHFPWIVELGRNGPIRVPRSQGDAMIRALLSNGEPPPLLLPDELALEEVVVNPRPRLKVGRPPRAYNSRLSCELSFDYGDQRVAFHDRASALVGSGTRNVMRRDRAAERQALERIRKLGVRSVALRLDPAGLQMAPKHLPGAVAQLLAEGWPVEAEGKLYRQHGAFNLGVRSGIDWFDLEGVVEFGESRVALPAVLAALVRGEKTVLLGDGSFGVLPEEWLKQYGLIARLGQREGEALRFSRNQAGLLDALLASQAQLQVDEPFRKARAELRDFEGIAAVEPPASFQGQLRPYQQEGLGWMQFLRRFGFGGCLADDMGLGKTVQVLALLEARRQEGALAGPSLVVVPRSLVFNWLEEATRFTPRLRILDHTGIGRSREPTGFVDCDLVLTTYGVLRRDILLLKDFVFDYAILDEAQTVKNARSETAKAVRLLQARHRLALSGTPIENHLGELWSLFEFLNPGMLGRSGALTRLAEAKEEERVLLARALRPFLLRRTKEQVAKDLPAKTEQTLHCELDPEQRKLYDQLKEHYRHSLLARVERDGLAKSKILILEALLRLRQAACHPALIDPSRHVETGAKLEALLPALAEVMEEGHKALVFSQFTSLLALLRQRLDSTGVVYEYLDGQTRNRQAKVQRFQEDPDCPLFLISLKAGGLGLNLTAAEYVFLLDPWWNPAVEAQAVDRTHRIGQTRPVFAYRLIAKDTIEDKVLALQEKKRQLADAIVNADDSLLRTLKREDLELLLS